MLWKETAQYWKVLPFSWKYKLTPALELLVQYIGADDESVAYVMMCGRSDFWHNKLLFIEG